jgi:hypothetical protein
MVLFGALAALACSGDPTDNEGTPTAITATPDVVFVTQGDSQAVIAAVVDEDGQILQADLNATNVGGGIVVVEDPTYRAVQGSLPIQRETRFFVKGVDLTATTFTLEAAGLTKDIQVTSVPGTLSATISNPTPALGDTISITAPTGTFFTATSVLTFGGAAAQVVSQDASTITFIPFPNIFGPAVVSDVGVTSNPNLTFTLATPDTVRTDSIANIGGGVSPTAPALGAPITIVLPPELRVIPESLVQSGVGADTIPRGVTIAGNDVRPLNISVSADSTTISLIPPPNSDSTVVVPGVIARRLPMYPLLLETTAKVTTPVVDVVPSTVSDAAPDVNEAVTLTRTDANFAFSPSSAVTVGALAAAVSAVAGDGSSITFIPQPGATGPVTVSGVSRAGFSLTLPSSATPITVSAEIPTIAGTEDPGTAPSLLTPAEGFHSVLVDKPAYNNADRIDAFYELVVTQEGVYTITVDWDIGTDIDLFLCPEAGVATFDCDFQAATGAHPEIGQYALTPGTYFVVVEDFGVFTAPGPAIPDAAGTTLQIDLEHGPPAAAAVASAKARLSTVRKARR